MINPFESNEKKEEEKSDEVKVRSYFNNQIINNKMR